MPRTYRIHRFGVLLAVLLAAPVAWDSTVVGRSRTDAGVFDIYEPDDVADDASTITPGAVQQHNFHMDGDEDWVKFQVTEGRPFTIFTSRLGIDVDTVLELYASDATTFIVDNDDGGTDLWSRISYTPTETGFYFVKVRQYGAFGTGNYLLTLERAPRVYLDAGQNADVLTYQGSTGNWAREVSNGTGGFSETTGNWAPGWTATPASFDDDALTDFFLFNPSTGAWAKMLNNGASGFTTQATGGWWPGWERHIMNLDDDGISDMFLYDPATGIWFKCISAPSGFTYEQGGWNAGWEIYPMKLNIDQLDDMFLIDRTTGRWFWVMGDMNGFDYPVTDVWFPGWVMYPGDFNGDGLSDFLLHDPPTGIYFVVTTGDEEFTYTQGGWSLGWTPWVADFNADGSDDLFLHDADTGRWFEMISDSVGGFDNAGGGAWSLGWNLSFSDFNGDGRSDAFLYHPTSGVWYQALNLSLGSFTYGNGTWNPGLQVVVRPPIR